MIKGDHTMYFLKKNALNVIIFILIFGVIGTIINLVVPAGSYEYEEYYTIDGEVSPNMSGTFNALINDNVNNQFVEKTAMVTHNANSNILQLNISTNSRDDISTVKSQVDNIIADQGYIVSETNGANSYQTENTILKIFIIVLSLFIGLIIGLIISLLNRNISSDEDFEYYLGEKTLGTF